ACISSARALTRSPCSRRLRARARLSASGGAAAAMGTAHRRRSKVSLTGIAVLYSPRIRGCATFRPRPWDSASFSSRSPSLPAPSPPSPWPRSSSGACRPSGRGRAVKRRPRERRAREQLARAYARGANPGAAIEQYRALRELAPEDPEYAYQLGRAYLRLSEWAMQRLRAIDPGSARIYQALGHNYRVQGRADRAVRAFERAAQADPRPRAVHLAPAQIQPE